MILDEHAKMLHFRGYWGEGDKENCEAPWETWVVLMAGQEAGDVADSAEVMTTALKASGYELVLRKTDTGEETVFPPRENKNETREAD